MKWVDTANVRSAFVQPYQADDGTMLSADVYRPPRPGSYPVLVTRTPYDNNRMGRRVPGTVRLAPAPADRFKLLAASGCVVVAADVRGRGDSDGEFVPFAQEAADGAATMRWARSLDESDGRVVTFGSGYAGFCALAAAVGAPEEVAGVFVVSPFGPDGLPDRGGVVRLDWLFWQHLCGGRTLQAVDVVPWGEVFRHLPLGSMHTALGRSDIPWRQWLEAGAPPAVSDVLDRAGSLSVPVMATTGWWDPDLRNTVAYHAAVGGRLVIGPWDARSARSPQRHVGGADWGVASLVDHDEELLAFVATLDDPPAGARVFMTGRNDWRTFPGWPPAGTTVRELHLGSSGAANTRRGDGTLAAEAGGEADRDTCVADPEQPPPLAPAFTSFSGNAPVGVSLDEAALTARDDALCYTAAPADAELSVMGRPRAVLWVETDAPDADVIVTLSDVFPYNGRSVHLSHSAVRLATVGGFAPGSPARVELEFGDVCHELLPGHALRLTVTTGLFPLYARNPHQPDYLDASEARLALLTVHHGADTPSALFVPVARLDS